MDIVEDLLMELAPSLLLGELKQSHEQLTERTAARLQRLEAENYELKLNLSLLVRLLITRGVFTASDFTSLVEQTKAELQAAARAKLKARAAATAKKAGPTRAAAR